jgi:hypothetical protein
LAAVPKPFTRIGAGVELPVVLEIVPPQAVRRSASATNILSNIIGALPYLKLWCFFMIKPSSPYFSYLSGGILCQRNNDTA